jgi:hypothetical protein
MDGCGAGVQQRGGRGVEGGAGGHDVINQGDVVSTDGAGCGEGVPDVGLTRCCARTHLGGGLAPALEPAGLEGQVQGACNGLRHSWAWLYPRSRILEGCNGSGTTASTDDRRTKAAMDAAMKGAMALRLRNFRWWTAVRATPSWENAEVASAKA